MGCNAHSMATRLELPCHVDVRVHVTGQPHGEDGDVEPRDGLAGGGRFCPYAQAWAVHLSGQSGDQLACVMRQLVEQDGALGWMDVEVR